MDSTILILWRFAIISKRSAAITKSNFLSLSLTFTYSISGPTHKPKLAGNVQGVVVQAAK